MIEYIRIITVSLSLVCDVTVRVVYMYVINTFARIESDCVSNFGFLS